MNDTTMGLELVEEAMLAFEVSDEALEIAAGTGKEKVGNFTLGACTGLSVCPADHFIDWSGRLEFP